MVNLRQRPAATAKVTKAVPAKRTSSRNAAASPSKARKYAEPEEDVEIDEESEGSSSEAEVSEESSSVVEECEDSIVIEDEEGSEDDKEIRRIIETTEAETKNIPLTARQRAKLEGGLQEEEGIDDQNDAKALTDEQALRKSEKSRRRKLQRDQKIEETKRATIERLLSKQKKTPAPEVDGSSEESLNRAGEISADPFSRPVQSGFLRCIDNSKESTLQFPDETTFEAAFSDLSAKPQASRSNCICQVCAKNPSKYTHPSKGTLFCSSSCYKMIK